MKRRLVIAITWIVLASGVLPAKADLLDHLLHPFHTTRKVSSKPAGPRVGEVVWSGLVMADNAQGPTNVPVELERIEPTLKELFGYNHFDVIGQSRNRLVTGQEDWQAASSKHFVLHVDAQGPDGGGYIVNLKLVQHDTTEPPSDQLVLETATKLSRRSPLVIKGPQIGDGQLLLVLVVQ
jgi:hypothetical protein